MCYLTCQQYYPPCVSLNQTVLHLREPTCLSLLSPLTTCASRQSLIPTSAPVKKKTNTQRERERERENFLANINFREKKKRKKEGNIKWGQLFLGWSFQNNRFPDSSKSLFSVTILHFDPNATWVFNTNYGVFMATFFFLYCMSLCMCCNSFCLIYDMGSTALMNLDIKVTGSVKFLGFICF